VAVAREASPSNREKQTPDTVFEYELGGEFDLTCIAASLHGAGFSKLWRTHAKVPASNFPLSFAYCDQRSAGES